MAGRDSDVERSLKLIGLVLSALVAAGVVGGSVSRSVAREVVGPVDSRVTTLEAQRTEDVKRLDEIRNDVKDILREMRK